MNKQIHSSREQFETAKQELLDPPQRSSQRQRSERSSWQLVKCFVQLLRGQRGAMSVALGTLTVETVLALVPPAATKIIVDYVLGKQPLPESVPAWVPREQWPLLMMMTVAVLIISLGKRSSTSGGAGMPRV